jgi:uncharacterized protein (DUF697 family)/GTPase Era involved in 16S rRNA processing
VTPSDPIEEGLRRQLSDTLLRLEDLLGRYAPAGMRERVAELRRLLVEQRPPRLALVGRRGAGKSSLVNALFGEKLAELGHVKSQTGEAQWFERRGERGAIDVLDTRGLQEGSPPEAPDPATTAVESLRVALRAKAPDAILFLVRASDVDSAIDEDIRVLSSLCREVDAHNGAKIAVLAVVTHCDQVEPQNVRLHDTSNEVPADVAEKLARIEAIKRVLDDRLRARPELRDRLIAVLGVSTYQSWRQDNSRRADERWAMDPLVRYLFDELPREAQVEFARFARVRKFQHDIASTLTTTVAGACAAIAAAPIPVADIVSITSAQTTLVMAIGYVSGRRLSVETAAEFLGALGANVGAAFALREAARALAKVVAPGAGGLVSSTIAFAGTASIGKAAAAYFIDGVTKESARKIFERAFSRHKK